LALEFDKFRTLVESHTRFVLTTHVNPDGDALGTEVAVALHLQQQGKQATILNCSATPDNFAFLEKLYPILLYNPEEHDFIIEFAEVIIVLDTNSTDRLVTMKEVVSSSKAYKVCIDHHLEPDAFADLFILDENSAATGEIIYRLISYLTGRVISKEIAIALYAAIMTDTGSFRFPKTDPEIHKIVAQLVQMGADPVEIYEHIYEKGTLNRVQLLGMALANIQLAHDGKVAYIVLTREMFEMTCTDDFDTDAFVPYTMTISGVQIGLMFSDRDDIVKINFRSKGDIWINELAKEFGGNGHKNAAGARIPRGKLDELVPQILEHASAYLL
jgi:bifunctional oligoribonuclease and PAP phosphatase NrnA